jgi:hypothetical protein
VLLIKTHYQLERRSSRGGERGMRKEENGTRRGEGEEN